MSKKAESDVQKIKNMSDNEKAIFQYDLNIQKIGESRFESHLDFSTEKGDDKVNFVPEDERVVAFNEKSIIDELNSLEIPVPSFEKAGPRKNLFFEPGHTTSAIVTCGGICPGLNAVIRSLVMMNYYRYKNQRTFGIRYGYEGLEPKFDHEVELLTPQRVVDIQSRGGTILGSSRGQQDTDVMINRLVDLGVNVIYTIGGDGTQRAALEMAEEIQKRNLKISVIAIPKTIDNDVNYIDKSFGMETAFSEACDAIHAARTESKSARNGIGIVKVMGRESGFIAANATLATNEVNFCLVPELDFDLEGEKGFLPALEERIKRRRNATIVVAEGAGQTLVENMRKGETDPSGNKKLGDIGLFLKDRIKDYMARKDVSINIKYIDPSYIIRSVGPTPNDAIFCSQLGQMAVHAGMTGRTGMVVGFTNGNFTHIPISVTTSKRKKIDPESQLWLSVLESTGQPMSFKND